MVSSARGWCRRPTRSSLRDISVRRSLGLHRSAEPTPRESVLVSRFVVVEVSRESSVLVDEMNSQGVRITKRLDGR